MFDTLRNLIAKRPHSHLVVASMLTCLALTAPNVQAGTWEYAYSGPYSLSGGFDYTDGVGFSDISIYNGFTLTTDTGAGLTQDPTGTVFEDNDYIIVFGNPLNGDPTPSTAVLFGEDYSNGNTDFAGEFVNEGEVATATPEPTAIQTSLIGTICLILVARRRWWTERKSQSSH